MDVQRYLRGRCGQTAAGIHLQWFAAEDEGRTEEPTPYRLRRAREEGSVARSVELPAAFVLLAGVLTLAVMARSLVAGAVDLLRVFLSQASTLDVTRDPAVVAMALRSLIRLAAPVAVAAFLAALASNLVQTGVRFTVAPILPDLRRIALRPGRHLRRALCSAEAGFTLAMSILKVMLVGGIAYLNIRAEMESLVGMAGAALSPSLEHVAGIAVRIAVQTAVALLLVGAADYLFRRRAHRQALRMSRREVAEERRQLDGDPLVRRRLRERGREVHRIRRWPT